MNSSQPKFVFKNLQPISYLTQFNRMVEDTKKHPLQSSARSEPSLIPLTPFPISRYYQDMEGIFENTVRKKQDVATSQRSSQHAEEERFMQKHNNFMKKTLTKFIAHNQGRADLLEREKLKLRTTPKPQTALRSSSQRRLIKKIESKTPQLPNVATLKAETPPLTTSLSRDQANHPEIINLQVKQARRQASFAEKIEQQIAEFQREMQRQVRVVKQVRFWREAAAVDIKSILQQGGGVPSEAVQLQFHFKNFTST